MSLEVLLVDDHQLLRQGLRSMLEKEPGLRVVGEAADGRAAIRLAQELKPDVVVMDFGMRELNGADATRQILSEHGATKVVALSVSADRVHVLQMLESGASGYVLKAAAYDELRRAIFAAAEGQTFLSPEVASAVVDAHRESKGKASVRGTPLSGREREVLQLISEGYTSPEIAERLFISGATVDTHRRNLTKKLGRRGVAGLTKYAIRIGLTQVET